MLKAKINSREEYLDELERLLMQDNYFSLMEIDSKRGSIRYNSEWVGFKGFLEERVLSYYKIDDIHSLVDIGYNIFVIDLVTLSIWAKREGKAIVHRTVVEQVFKDFLEPKAVRKSLVHGMVSESIETPKRKPSRGLRKKIKKNFKNRCVLCGNYIDLSLHHILPFRHGGLTEEDNFILICKKCHKTIEFKKPFEYLPKAILDTLEKKQFAIYLWSMWSEDSLKKLRENE